jgi:glycosyltransferase involved in cell wall biosynthesis
MPFHSIIVPHKNRAMNLAVCLSSLAHSAKICKVSDKDFEVIVVGDTPRGLQHSFCRTVAFTRCPPVRLAPNEPTPYHKTAVLNAGIDSARGDVLSFLDADAVVGPRWFQNIAILEGDSPIKVAYRVRYAEYEPWQGQWIKKFSEYEKHRLAFEAYGEAHDDWAQRINNKEVPLGKPFGNSQHSIRRDVLGDLRYDERYVGRGFDDIHFARALAEKYGERYRAEMITDGPHALFHIRHRQSPGFNAGPRNERNKRLYHNEPVTWYLCPNARVAEGVQVGNPMARTVWPPNEWQLSLAIPGLDTVIEVEDANP